MARTAKSPTNRIAELRHKRGLSMDRLAERVQPPTGGSVINKLEKGERRLTVQWMRRLADALDCEPAELLPGAGPPLTPEEQAVIAQYRGLPERDRSALRRVLDGLAASAPEEG